MNNIDIVLYPEARAEYRMDLKTGKISIHAKTQDEADRVLELLKNRGLLPA